MKKHKLFLTAATALTLGFSSTGADLKALKEKALLYLPMEKGNVMQLPKSGADLELLGGEPLFAKGKKGEALAIDSEGVSIKGIKIKGQNLFNGEQGTIAFWMKPLIAYNEGKGRHYFFAARKNNGHFAYIISPNAGFYFQTVKDKKWISPHFNFRWWKKPSWSSETWYHLAITWGVGKETTFYVNGEPIHKEALDCGAKTVAPAIFVGCGNDEKDQADALIDEFYIFSGIISKEDIAALMNDK